MDRKEENDEERTKNFHSREAPCLLSATHLGLGGKRNQAQCSKFPSTGLPNWVALPLYKSASLSPLETPSVRQE